MPIKQKMVKNKKVIYSRKGNILISADYNQIEMRMLADLADVKQLKAFKNNDIHSLTADKVFNIDLKKITSEMKKAKAINFGIFTVFHNMV